MLKRIFHSFLTFFLPRKLRMFISWAWYEGVQRVLWPDKWERRRLELLVGPCEAWEPHQRFMFDFILKEGLKPEHYLIDLGCGPLSVGLALIPYLEKGHYFGVDIRESAIAEAYRQVAKAGLAKMNPSLIVSSTFGAEELGDLAVDYVLASAVIYHLLDEQADKCFIEVAKRLKDDGVFCCNVNTVVPESRWYEFPFVCRSIDFYKALGERYGLVMKAVKKLSELGYPESLPAKSNHMLEFRKIRQ